MRKAELKAGTRIRVNMRNLKTLCIKHVKDDNWAPWMYLAFQDAKGKKRNLILEIKDKAYATTFLDKQYKGEGEYYNVTLNNSKFHTYSIPTTCFEVINGTTASN